MFTRKDYLAKKCTHREYYAQFVDATQKQLVARKFNRELVAGLPVEEWGYLNKWDQIGVMTHLVDKMKAAGDTWSMAGAVCINKEAARQLLEDRT